jgi:hypothetical protein
VEEVIVKGWKETKIANSFTSNFQVVTMEADALTFLFYFILEVENNIDAKKQ